MINKMRNRSFVILLALWGCLASSSAAAQTSPEFYKGKQITMLISTAAGGGYDTYARALARHMVKHIPGDPAIVPKNTRGADGAIAASTLYNTTGRIAHNALRRTALE